MPRRTWLDNKIDVFLEELAASGMHLDRQRADELITGQVRAVAALMRVTEAAAHTYLDDEIIKDMARRMPCEVAGERPGADLMEAPRTVPLSLALVGITVAALAEAMQADTGAARPASGRATPATRSGHVDHSPACRVQETEHRSGAHRLIVTGIPRPIRKSVLPKTKGPRASRVPDHLAETAVGSL